MSTNNYAALEAAIRSTRMSFSDEANAGTRSSTEIVACEGLLPAWSSGKFKAGDLRTHDGQAWKCLQDHDSTGNETWAPGLAASLWTVLHTTDPARAKPFVQPTGAHDAYLKGEAVLWTDGKVYVSIMETANSYSPEAYPQGWALAELA